MIGSKGQEQSTWKWILGVTVVLIGASTALLIWQTVNQAPPFPTSPADYAAAWKDYGEATFTTSEGDQPWRVLSLFFFPILLYFSLIFFAINLVFANSKIERWYDAQKPLIVFAFSVAFIILPFPTTYTLYQILGGITYIIPAFIWIVMITAVVMVFYHTKQHQQDAIGGGKPWYKKDKDEKETKDWDLTKEVDNLEDLINKFKSQCDDAIKEKDGAKADRLIGHLARYLEQINTLGRKVDRSKLPAWQKLNSREKLIKANEELRDLLEKLKKVKEEHPTDTRKELERKYLDTVEKAKDLITDKFYRQLTNPDKIKEQSDEGLNGTIKQLEETIEHGIPTPEKGIECPNCGAINRKDATYCHKCGKGIKPGAPKPPSKLSELEPSQIEKMSPDKLKKIEKDAKDWADKLSKIGQKDLAKDLNDVAVQAKLIREKKEKEKPEEKKPTITPQELDLVDKTRAELRRSVDLAGKIVDLTAKIPQPKVKDKITEDAEREFMEAIRTYKELWAPFHEILLNKQRFETYVKGQKEPFAERILGDVINRFSNNCEKLKSGRKKLKEAMQRLVSAQNKAKEENDKDAFNRYEQNILRINKLLSVVRDEEIRVLGKHTRDAKKSLVRLKEELTKKTMTKKK